MKSYSWYSIAQTQDEESLCRITFTIGGESIVFDVIIQYGSVSLGIVESTWDKGIISVRVNYDSVYRVDVLCTTEFTDNPTITLQPTLGEYTLSTFEEVSSGETKAIITTESHLTTQDLERILSNYFDKEAITELLSTITESIPTKVSELQNDSDFVDKNYVGGEIAKIQVPTKVTDLQDANDYATKSFVGEEVAKISIPTKTSQLQNDSGFATESFVRSEVGKIVVPAKVSDLQNDSGFITPSALNGYATQTYVDNAITQSLGEIETILGGI